MSQNLDFSVYQSSTEIRENTSLNCISLLIVAYHMVFCCMAPLHNVVRMGSQMCNNVFALLPLCNSFPFFLFHLHRSLCIYPNSPSFPILLQQVIEKIKLNEGKWSWGGRGGNRGGGEEGRIGRERNS